jgi:hypothetical protein
MIWWILALAVLTILSYLVDVGGLAFLKELRVPFLQASLLSILILLCTLGVLGRMLLMSGRGEKEDLVQKIRELEDKIKTLQGKREV